MVFKLVFANNTILSCFFLFFLFIDLCFLIHAVITPIFTAAAELVISTGVLTKEAKAETETHSETVEAKLSKCPVWFKILLAFLILFTC